MAAPSQIIDSGVHSRPGVHSHRPLKPFWLDSIVKSQVLRLQRTRCTQQARGTPSQAEGSVAKPAPRVGVIHPPGTHPDGEQAERLRSEEQGSMLGERPLLHIVRKDKLLALPVLRGGGLHQQSD